MKVSRIKAMACAICLAASGMLAMSPASAQGQGKPVLKVCADPNYLPYSNHAGQGFENDVAQFVASKLGMSLDYVWADSRAHGGFDEYLARNLDNGHCDVVMNMPYGSQEELTTEPYYVSSYVFVFKKNRNYDLRSLDSPQLRKMKIGFESDTPVEDGLQLRGMVTTAKPYDIGSDSGSSPREVLDDVESGKLDVMITWQPSIGAYLKDFPDLTIVPLPNTRATGSPEMYSFPMSMAVRKDDQALKTKLDSLIKASGPALQSLLHKHGVAMPGDNSMDASDPTGTASL